MIPAGLPVERIVRFSSSLRKIYKNYLNIKTLKFSFSVLEKSFSRLNGKISKIQKIFQGRFYTLREKRPP